MKIVMLVLTLLLGGLHTEDYQRNPEVDEAVWNTLKPYFLPPTKPVKQKLDEIFNGKRPTASAKALFQAGFHLTSVQGIRATVVKHPNIPGYVFKMLLDDQRNTRLDWQSWYSRVRGAESIRRAIAKLKVGDRFCVANKWIYPLPEEPRQALGAEPRHFILVAENLHPLPREENIKKWNELNDKTVLDGLFALVTKLGLADSNKENNIPWCKNGKIAFVDTEHHHDPCIRFDRLEKVLNKKMINYWRKLQRKQKRPMRQHSSQSAVCPP